MEQARRILPRLLQHGDDPRQRELDLIRAYWSLTVGPLLAEHSKPALVEPPKLVVEVGDPVWLEQFLPMRQEITTLLRQELPDTTVRTIEFGLSDPRGPGAGSPHRGGDKP